MQYGQFKQMVESGQLTPRNQNVYLSYVRHKYEAMTTTPTSLEATMTFEQLFSANNPLWTKYPTINEQMRIARQIREHGRDYVCEHLAEYITIPK